MHPGLHEITFGADDAGGRLDRALADRLGAFSRARVKALIKEGKVALAGEVVTAPNRTVQPGERYVVEVPEVEPAVPRGENIPLAVLFEDADLIVVDKPAGLVVHPAAGNWTGTLVNALIAHCGDSLSGIGGVKRPGIVHRLDKDTSGVMVVAKSDRAHAGLAAQFASHGADGRLTRAYTAFVWGAPERAAGTIDVPIGRDPYHRTRRAVVARAAIEARSDARHAVTHYFCERVFATERRAEALAQLTCRLETGRTHQIRVHLAYVGHPLLGDAVYGRGYASGRGLLGEAATAAFDALGRQALHAHELGFEHPVDGRPLCFSSPLPDDLKELVAGLQADSS
ncbi:MAG: RluA family pseudouridine synthase [Pseudomonadota bacterium]